MFKKDIFHIQSQNQFETTALAVFKHQFEHNTVYRSFCDLLYKHPSEIHALEDIPFLPIDLFKSHKVICDSKATVPPIVFESSGTTGTQVSKHYVTDIALYEHSFITNFEMHYGSVKDYAILALLPSYLERGQSSLVYMVDHLIKKGAHPESGFFLYDHFALSEKLKMLEQKGQKTLLIGVSYALLDFIESHPLQLEHTIVMETGGMKGRRKEMIRAELHQLLREGFGVDHIHSEYGMTELLSQAYSKGEGIFKTPPWMKILIRDPEDPFALRTNSSSGGINIIDLCNVNSCAFIATQDIGNQVKENEFSILGRFDNSDVRGCNLLVV